MLVLLVDDDDSLRRALARTIRLAKFEVEAFKSVEALLARGVPERDLALVRTIRDRLRDRQGGLWRPC